MPPSVASLRDLLGRTPDASGRYFRGAKLSVALDDLLGGTSLGGRLPELAGRSVLIRTRDQLPTALALIELDGVARRLVVCPSDVARKHLAAVVADAGVDAVVSDPEPFDGAPPLDLTVACNPAALIATGGVEIDRRATEWVLLTSGTTGAPKMLAHGLDGLIGAIKPNCPSDGDNVWSTFYDIRRFGGLQIFLRAVLGDASLVLSSAEEPVGDFLGRLGKHGVTHISGTPSHWRRALMSPSARAMAPNYVRLSGEIADQAILDNLRSFYPQASLGHAYASTEAGVAFEVIDGLEGFPADFIGRRGDVEMRVVDGSLRIRSPRTATRYVGLDAPAVRDAQGFVDTGDMLERRGERYYFLGRRSGVINVGGQKVHPEEVEAAINRHPDVRMSLVQSRRNPITGAIVAADVILKQCAQSDPQSDRAAQCKREILQICRERLAQHKIPATIRFVSALDVAATGKLTRHA